MSGVGSAPHAICSVPDPLLHGLFGSSRLAETEDTGKSCGGNSCIIYQLQFCRVIQVKHLRKASVIKMIWWAALPPPLEGSLSELFWNMEQLKLVLAQACTSKTFRKVVHVPAWYWWQYAKTPCRAQSCQDSKAVSVLTAMSEVYLVAIWNCVPEQELARSKWNPSFLLSIQTWNNYKHKSYDILHCW